MKQNSEIIIYTAPDGTTKLQVQLEDETVWLTQEQMAMLFGKGRTTITEHIGNIFKEDELNEKEVCRLFRHTTKHGAIEGKTQNKMHFAIHGQTAAEMINERVDSDKPFLGLTSFEGKYITTRDIGIAKNYLSKEELKQLNLIVSMYLDFAELQATNGRLMKMHDWIQKLDDFLKVSEKELLTNAGKINHQKAIEKAKFEYDKYRNAEDKKYISDFDREMKKLLKKDDKIT